MSSCRVRWGEISGQIRMTQAGKPRSGSVDVRARRSGFVPVEHLPKGAPKSIPQVFQHTGLLQPSGPQKYDMGGSGRGRSNLSLRVTDSSEKKPGFGSAKRTALVSVWFPRVFPLDAGLLALWAVESFAISTASGFHYLHGIARPSVRVALAERGRKGLQRLERPGILTLL